MFNPLPKPEPRNKSNKEKTCVKCGSKRVVNKTHSLCYDCNQERLHGSGWKQDKIRHSEELLAKKVSNYSKIKKVSQKPLKQVSKTNSYTCSDGSTITQSQIDSRYTSTCKQIDLTREPVCESCGRGGVPLSHSHTISRRRLKDLGKSELIYDENGLFLECFVDSDSCHYIWEHGSLKDQMKLRTFDQKLAYIKEYDSELYQKFFLQIKEL